MKILFFVTAILLSSLLGPMVFADDLQERVTQLENRVLVLEKSNSSICQDGIDSIVNAGAFYYDRKTDGQFVNSQSWFKSMFDVKVVKKISDGGKDYVLVRNRSCKYFYYLASDVLPING